jgi:hypothetical protein
MENTYLVEGFDYHDLKGLVVPKVTVDEYKSRVGTDSDIVTLAFTIKSEEAGKDLCSWFERGYDFVLDAKVSDGELPNGNYLVFVEMNRRRSVPERIIRLIKDMITLTDLKLKDWSIVVKEEEYDADIDTISQVIITSPSEYKIYVEKEDELNEMRLVAGLNSKKLYEQDTEILNFKAIAGL